MNTKNAKFRGNLLVVDDAVGEQYQIEIEQGEYLVIEAGSVVGHAGARFEHPNVAATSKRVFEFKHYRHGGSKFWTAKAGVSHYFVVPRSEVKILPHKGYSYIKAEINGAKVTFNVGGGTINGWTDWLRTHVSVFVNMRVKDLKAIAAVSVRGTELEPVVVEQMEPYQEERWNSMAAKANKKIRNQIFKMVEDGKKPIVKLNRGYTISECVGLKLDRQYKRVPMDEPGHFSLEPIGAVKSITATAEGYWGNLRTKLSQIDWMATAIANGVVV